MASPHASDRRSPLRVRLRVVLIALVALPLFASLLFAVLWANERSDDAVRARASAEEVAVITDSAELRFSVEIDMLIGYGPISSIDPRGEAQNDGRRDGLRARQAFLAETLLARGEVLERLGGTDASYFLQSILDDLRALWDSPSSPDNLEIHQDIADRLAVIDKAISSAAAGNSAEVAYTMREFGRLQDLMRSEALLIIDTLAPANRTPANSALIDDHAARERETIEDLADVVAPDEMERLREEADQPGIQSVRDAIAADAGIPNRGEGLDSIDLTTLVDSTADWFYAVPRARESYSTEAVRAANERAAEATAGRKLAIGAALALMIAIALVTPLAIRSVTRPLRSLARRASVAAAGDLPGRADRRSTISEIAAVDSSFERLADFMRTVESQIAALGLGRTDDPALTERLPGTIGEDLERSVQRLTATTDQLRASEALSQAVVDSAVDGIWTLSEDLLVLGANSAAEEMAGCPEEELVGRPLAAAHPEIATYLSAGVRQSSEQEFELEGPSDRPISALVSVREVADARGTPILTVFVRDVSDRKHLEDRLSHQAHHDHLTGLPNRMSLIGAIDRSLHQLEPGSGLGVLFLDLDRFKLVNDALGHECGDQLLVAVGERIQTTLRDGDFVARLGGDEFVIVLPGLSCESEAQEAGDRVRGVLGQPIDIGSVDQMRVEASVGVAFTADPAFQARDLLHRADLAMYRAKQSGRARVELYDSEMQAWASHRNRIEQGLRNALIAGDLEAHVQPIIDLDTQRVVGGELLSRWFHQGEWVPPDVFIPLAEESALIGELGKWVLHRACEIIGEWESRGWDLYLTVNISGLHLMTGEVDTDIASALAAHPIDPRHLKIEITESFLLGDPETAIDRLTTLRNMGLSIFVDDFGTGYSSLTYLRRLPIDGIKLDRAFVSDIDDSAADTTIVDLVSDLAASLGLSTVAEGIENEAQLECVRRSGYDLGQGWLWAKAMAMPDFIEWVDRQPTVPSGTNEFK